MLTIQLVYCFTKIRMSIPSHTQASTNYSLWYAQCFSELHKCIVKGVAQEYVFIHMNIEPMQKEH